MEHSDSTKPCTVYIKQVNRFPENSHQISWCRCDALALSQAKPSGKSLGRGKKNVHDIQIHCQKNLCKWQQITLYLNCFTLSQKMALFEAKTRGNSLPSMSKVKPGPNLSPGFFTILLDTFRYGCLLPSFFLRQQSSKAETDTDLKNFSPFHSPYIFPCSQCA